MRDVLTEGNLWSWVRSVMCQGADIRVDYDMGNHKGYEAYSARLDAAASERAAEFYSARILPAIQSAARLGAERARERCIDAAAGAFPVSVTAGSPYARGYDDGVHAALGAIRKYAAAIRRGEGEQA